MARALLVFLCALMGQSSAVTFGRRSAAGTVPQRKNVSQQDADPDAGVFWYNTVNGDTSANRPACLGYLSKNYNRPFWRTADGEPTWEAPPEASWRELRDLQDRPYYRSDLLDITTWEKPECLGWKRLSLDKKFYHNHVTGESVWSDSPKVPKYLGVEDPKSKRKYYINDEGKSVWESPFEESHWYVGTDPQTNREYYYNPKSSERTWSVPANSALAWQLQHAPADDDAEKTWGEF